MYEEVAALWKEVFGDSDEFIKLFFDNVYKPENTLVVKRNNQIVSALQIVPYKVKVNDLLLDAAYVCGICTCISERGKGFMNRLMAESQKLMKERGFAFSFLIPAEIWLFDIYKKAGYKMEIQKPIHKAQLYSVNPPIAPIEDIIACNTEYYTYFNKKQLERKCCILHDYKDFGIILQDNQMDGGKVFVALHHQAPAGMIFAKPYNDETVVITEILYDGEIVKEALLQFVVNYFNVKKFIHLQPHGLVCMLDKDIPDISELYMSLMLD
jgi:predicted acetyltransferase